MPAVLVTELILLYRTHRFFPSSGRNHRQYPFCLPTEGWPGWVGLGSLVEYEDAIPRYTWVYPCTVTHLSIWLNVELLRYCDQWCYREPKADDIWSIKLANFCGCGLVARKNQPIKLLNHDTQQILSFACRTISASRIHNSRSQKWYLRYFFCI